MTADLTPFRNLVSAFAALGPADTVRLGWDASTTTVRRGDSFLLICRAHGLAPGQRWRLELSWDIHGLQLIGQAESAEACRIDPRLRDTISLRSSGIAATMHQPLHAVRLRALRPGVWQVCAHVELSGGACAATWSCTAVEASMDAEL